MMKEPCPDAPRLNLVELKEGQPGGAISAEHADCPPIREDFEKLMLEVCEQGKSIVHILQAEEPGTIRSLLGKYNIAVRRAGPNHCSVRSAWSASRSTNGSLCLCIRNRARWSARPSRRTTWTSG